MKEKSQYKTLFEWKKDNLSDYAIAYRNNWITKLCKRFGWGLPKKYKPTNKRPRTPRSYWTKENIINEIKQYENRGDWITHDATTYRIAKENRWLDEIYALRDWKRNKVSDRIAIPSTFWTIKENVFDECRKHKVKRLWRKVSPASYASAYNNGWMDECDIILEKSFQKWMDEMYENL